MRKPALHGPLDEAGACVGGLPGGPEGVAAGDLLEHDSAPPLA
jgi:hypothetical protein